MTSWLAWPATPWKRSPAWHGMQVIPDEDDIIIAGPGGLPVLQTRNGQLENRPGRLIPQFCAAGYAAAAAADPGAAPDVLYARIVSGAPADDGTGDGLPAERSCPWGLYHHARDDAAGRASRAGTTHYVWADGHAYVAGSHPPLTAAWLSVTAAGEWASRIGGLTGHLSRPPGPHDFSAVAGELAAPAAPLAESTINPGARAATSPPEKTGDAPAEMVTAGLQQLAARHGMHARVSTDGIAIYRSDIFTGQPVLRQDHPGGPLLNQPGRIIPGDQADAYLATAARRPDLNADDLYQQAVPDAIAGERAAAGENARAMFSVASTLTSPTGRPWHVYADGSAAVATPEPPRSAAYYRVATDDGLLGRWTLHVDGRIEHLDGQPQDTSAIAGKTAAAPGQPAPAPPGQPATQGTSGQDTPALYPDHSPGDHPAAQESTPPGPIMAAPPGQPDGNPPHQPPAGDDGPVIARVTVLHGHISPDTAYPIDDYPYGRRLRCQMRVWIDGPAPKGQYKKMFRVVRQTNDPKRHGPGLYGEGPGGHPWNKENPGHYHDWVVLYRNDENGHIEAHVGSFFYGLSGPQDARMRLDGTYEQLTADERKIYDLMVKRGHQAERREPWYKALDFIRAYRADHGTWPSQDDVRAAPGFYLDSHDYDIAVAAARDLPAPGQDPAPPAAAVGPAAAEASPATDAGTRPEPTSPPQTRPAPGSPEPPAPTAPAFADADSARAADGQSPEPGEPSAGTAEPAAGPQDPRTRLLEITLGGYDNPAELAAARDAIEQMWREVAAAVPAEPGPAAAGFGAPLPRLGAAISAALAAADPGAARSRYADVRDEAARLGDAATTPAEHLLSVAAYRLSGAAEAHLTRLHATGPALAGLMHAAAEIPAGQDRPGTDPLGLYPRPYQDRTEVAAARAEISRLRDEWRDRTPGTPPAGPGPDPASSAGRLETRLSATAALPDNKHLVHLRAAWSETLTAALAAIADPQADPRASQILLGLTRTIHAHRERLGARHAWARQAAAPYDTADAFSSGSGAVRAGEQAWLATPTGQRLRTLTDHQVRGTDWHTIRSAHRNAVEALYMLHAHAAEHDPGLARTARYAAAAADACYELQLTLRRSDYQDPSDQAALEAVTSAAYLHAAGIQAARATGLADPVGADVTSRAAARASAAQPPPPEQALPQDTAPEPPPAAGQDITAAEPAPGAASTADPDGNGPAAGSQDDPAAPAAADAPGPAAGGQAPEPAADQAAAAPSDDRLTVLGELAGRHGLKAQHEDATGEAEIYQENPYVFRILRQERPGGPVLDEPGRVIPADRADAYLTAWKASPDTDPDELYAQAAAADPQAAATERSFALNSSDSARRAALARARQAGTSYHIYGDGRALIVTGSQPPSQLYYTVSPDGRWTGTPGTFPLEDRAPLPIHLTALAPEPGRDPRPEPPPGAAPGGDAAAEPVPPGTIIIEHGQGGTVIRGTSRDDTEVRKVLTGLKFDFSRPQQFWYLHRNESYDSRDWKVRKLRARLDSLGRPKTDRDNPLAASAGPDEPLPAAEPYPGLRAVTASYMRVLEAYSNVEYIRGGTGLFSYETRDDVDAVKAAAAALRSFEHQGPPGPALGDLDATLAYLSGVLEDCARTTRILQANLDAQKRRAPKFRPLLDQFADTALAEAARMAATIAAGGLAGSGPAPASPPAPGTPDAAHAGRGQHEPAAGPGGLPAKASAEPPPTVTADAAADQAARRNPPGEREGRDAAERIATAISTAGRSPEAAGIGVTEAPEHPLAYDLRIPAPIATALELGSGAYGYAERLIAWALGTGAGSVRVLRAESSPDGTTATIALGRTSADEDPVPPAPAPAPAQDTSLASPDTGTGDHPDTAEVPIWSATRDAAHRAGQHGRTYHVHRAANGGDPLRCVISSEPPRASAGYLSVTAAGEWTETWRGQQQPLQPGRGALLEPDYPLTLTEARELARALRLDVHVSRAAGRVFVSLSEPGTTLTRQETGEVFPAAPAVSFEYGTREVFAGRHVTTPGRAIAWLRTYRQTVDEWSARYGGDIFAAASGVSKWQRRLAHLVPHLPTGPDHERAVGENLDSAIRFAGRGDSDAAEQLLRRAAAASPGLVLAPVREAAIIEKIESDAAGLRLDPLPRPVHRRTGSHRRDTARAGLDQPPHRGPSRRPDPHPDRSTPAHSSRGQRGLRRTRRRREGPRPPGQGRLRPGPLR